MHSRNQYYNTSLTMTAHPRMTTCLTSEIQVEQAGSSLIQIQNWIEFRKPPIDEFKAKQTDIEAHSEYQSDDKCKRDGWNRSHVHKTLRI